MQNPRATASRAAEYIARRPASSVDGKYDGRPGAPDRRRQRRAGRPAGRRGRADEFEKLGFKVNLRMVPQDTMYTKFCGVPEREGRVCPNVGWFKDFEDPQSHARPDVRRRRTSCRQATQLVAARRPGDQRGDGQGRAADRSASERNQAWADINKKITAQAPGIPYVWDDSFQLASKNVNAVTNVYYSDLGPALHLAQVGVDRLAPGRGPPPPRAAAGRRRPPARHLEWPPTSSAACSGRCSCCSSIS